MKFFILKIKVQKSHTDSALFKFLHKLTVALVSVYLKSDYISS